MKHDHKDNPYWKGSKFRQDDEVTDGSRIGVITGRPSKTEVRVFWRNDMRHETVLEDAIRKTND